MKKSVGRLLVNTPASFGGIGLTTNLTPSVSLANRAYGQGMTADNVSPSNLIYIRKVAYGVRQVEKASLKQESTIQYHDSSTDAVQKVILDALRMIQNS